MKKKNIYLDYSASTPIDKKVILEMEKSYSIYANPSSIHFFGGKANLALNNARKKIADSINARESEVIFTGSGTESVNLAIQGGARSMSKKGKHIIISAVEHHCVLRSCDVLGKEGFEVEVIPVDKNGIVDSAKVISAIREDTVLISIMYVNNEVGTIQPIKEISKGIQLKRLNHKPLFHTDACQAMGYLDMNARNLGVDLLSISGSKVYGPKGIGALFVRHGVFIEPLIVGGDQENGLRGGTQSVALAVGFAKAVEISEKNRPKETMRLKKLNDYLIDNVLSKFPEAILNGDRKNRIPGNVNISFPNIAGEMLLLALNKYDVYVSTGSACTARETGPSHVLRAIYGASASDYGNIRITMGRDTKKEDIDTFLTILPKALKEAR